MQHETVRINTSTVSSCALEHLHHATLAHGIALAGWKETMIEDMLEHGRRLREGLAQTGILAPPTHGCMECKAQCHFTIEHFPNGNTGWRCTVCKHILRLWPHTHLLETP